VDIEDVGQIKKKLSSIKGQTGIAFSGGESFLQAEACKEIALFVKK
jgi:pyruvate-formate lyase-activating enzyme